MPQALVGFPVFYLGTSLAIDASVAKAADRGLEGLHISSREVTVQEAVLSASATILIGMIATAGGIGGAVTLGGLGIATGSIALIPLSMLAAAGGLTAAVGGSQVLLGGIALQMALDGKPDEAVVFLEQAKAAVKVTSVAASPTGGVVLVVAAASGGPVEVVIKDANIAASIEGYVVNVLSLGTNLGKIAGNTDRMVAATKALLESVKHAIEIMKIAEATTNVITPSAPSLEKPAKPEHQKNFSDTHDPSPGSGAAASSHGWGAPTTSLSPPGPGEGWDGAADDLFLWFGPISGGSDFGDSSEKYKKVR